MLARKYEEAKESAAAFQAAEVAWNAAEIRLQAYVQESGDPALRVSKRPKSTHFR